MREELEDICRRLQKGTMPLSFGRVKIEELFTTIVKESKPKLLSLDSGKEADKFRRYVDQYEKNLLEAIKSE